MEQAAPTDSSDGSQSEINAGLNQAENGLPRLPVVQTVAMQLLIEE